MLVLLLACAPPTLPTIDKSNTATSSPGDTTTTPLTGPCSRWAGDWDAEARCDGAEIGIPETGTASVDPLCGIDASTVFIGDDGSCRVTETFELVDDGLGPDTFAGQTTDVITIPNDCADEPTILPFDLGTVSIVTGPNDVILSFSGQPPWLIADCVGEAELVLTPSTGR